MFKHRISVLLVTLVMAVGIAACGQTATPPSSAAPLPSDLVSAPSEPPIASPSAVPLPTGSPTPTKSVTTPTSRPARWASTPKRIFAGECATVVATVDETGRFHVAAVCRNQIRYAESADGRSWNASTIATPTHRVDVGPQLAVDGTTLYLAFTRLRPVDGGCGDDGLTAVGVFYRTRTLPDGAWSKPKQIGPIGDHLQALRVVDGVIHETVTSDDGDGPVFYAAARGPAFEQVQIPGAEATSLRIAGDGRPRIAYSTPHAIKYAIVNDDRRLSISTIYAAKDVFMAEPVLVLGRGDHAFVSWAAREMEFGGGCAEPEPPNPPHKGTWFSTDVDGKWAAKRLSKDIGSASMALDVASGRLHATYLDQRGIRYVTRAPDGTWKGSRLDRSVDLWGLVLRRDPTSGRLLLVGLDGSESLKPGVYAVTAS
jgi:hypothetical protein